MALPSAPSPTPTAVPLVTAPPVAPTPTPTACPTTVTIAPTAPVAVWPHLHAVVVAGRPGQVVPHRVDARERGERGVKGA